MLLYYGRPTGHQWVERKAKPCGAAVMLIREQCTTVFVNITRCINLAEPIRLFYLLFTFFSPHPSSRSQSPIPFTHTFLIYNGHPLPRLSQMIQILEIWIGIFEITSLDNISQLILWRSRIYPFGFSFASLSQLAPWGQELRSVPSSKQYPR